MCDIHYLKSRKIDLGKLEKQYENQDSKKKEIKYNPFHITELQNYNPIYSLFFEMNENTYNSISLNHPRHFLDLNTIYDEKQQKKKTNISIHIKYAPLLDPVHYLIGKYEKERTRLCNLPKYNIETNAIPKITSVYNTAYIDCFFSYLSSQLLNHYDFKNGIDFYGSFLGIQKKFKMDITDDYEYLLESDFFNSHQNKLYELESIFMDTSAIITNDDGNKITKPKLVLGEDSFFEADLLENEIQDLHLSSFKTSSPRLQLNEERCIDFASKMRKDVNEFEKETEKNDLELIYEKIDNDDCSLSSYSSVNSSEDSVIKNSSSDEEEEDEEDDEDEDDEEEEEEEWSDIDDDNTNEEPQIFGYIHNFPVQMICLEKCEGTFDSLLEKDMMNDTQIISALFQIIMTLIAYQKAYYFTHNDLHTNNIVFIPTNNKYIKYEYLGKIYKVPTYGRIFKIIDFGRSIYKYQDKIFCSDSFAPGGDAHTQYNIEPFLNKNKPRLETNFSFDLSRLGCSLYDFVFNNEDEESIRKNTMQWTELQELVVRWCTDDNGKNILYKKSGEERYPNFKLYKMIARNVHGCLPEEQLSNAIFSSFSQKEKDLKDNDEYIFISIDKIPKMYT
jgi:hypothetical protein